MTHVDRLVLITKEFFKLPKENKNKSKMKNKRVYKQKRLTLSRNRPNNFW